MKALSVSSTRRSNRTSAKNNGPGTSKRSTITKRTSSSLPAKVHIDKVLDFKKSADLISYLVNVEGTSNTLWVTDAGVENIDVLTTYKRQIESESGYSVDQPVDLTEETSSKRPSRFSKTRALVAMKHPVNLDASDDEEYRGTKRKSNKVEGSTRKASNKLPSGGKVRKSKAQLLLEAQQQERLERQRARSNVNADAIISNMKHTHGKDCCLMCAASDYRKYLEKGDLKGFKALFNDWKNIPSYTEENKENGLSLIGYAIILEKFQFAEFAVKFDSGNNNRKIRPSIPEKYKNYGDNTGFNAGYYGRQAFRKVQESRGNRLGNSAFYADTNNKATFMNVEGSITDCNIRPYLPYITDDVFTKPAVIDNYMNFESDNVLSAYYAANAGNRRLALKLIKLNDRTFNHLHQEVLKFDGKKKLTNYKRTQILKFASDANNLTPYHCAAIHPSSSYLQELFEVLDAAERLETDAFGRNVAFYAAVSETTDCLEFLLSKNFIINTFDKYKMTPLIQAARFGRSHNVEILVKELNGGQDATDISEATYKTLNRNRRTALHYAAYFGHPETCRVLINFHAPVEAVENLDKQTALHYAAKNGHLECVRILIEEGKSDPEKGDKYGRNALHLACIAGHLKVVKYLLSQGLNVDAGDSSSNYPVHYAAAFGHLDVLHLLIEYGKADPNSSNVWRTTPCSIANTKGHLAIVKYLLQLKENPVDVNFKDQEGYTILQRAIDEPICSESEIDLNMNKIELLVSMKADPNSVDLNGCSSLHILAQQTKFINLYPKGRTPFYAVKNPAYYFTDPEPYEFEDMDGIEYILSIGRLLIKNGADLDAKNNSDETPLCTAMKKNNHHLVALLIESGAKFWLDADKDGNNFFHYFGSFTSAISRFQPHCGFDRTRQERLLKIANKIWSLVEKQLKAGVDIKSVINAPNNDGYTPLLSSVKSVIEHQRAKLTREKLMIKTELERLDRNDTASGYGALNSSKLLQDTRGVIDVDLRFDMKHYLKFLEKLIEETKPDLNSLVALPKDFKKNNPNAKKSDYPAWTGHSALHFACQAQALDLVELLLRHGANANSRIQLDNDLGGTPLIVGFHVKTDRKQELTNDKPETLESLGKRFNVTKPDFAKMADGQVELLLRYGASPYIPNEKGNSALSIAAACVDAKNVEAMCKVKPSASDNVNEKNEQNETVLMVALASKKKFTKLPNNTFNDLLKNLLLAEADPNVLYEDGGNVLMKAIELNYVDYVKILIENTVVPLDHSHQNKKLDTALTIACKLNHPEILPLYLTALKANAENSIFDANHYNCDWCTPLFYVCKNGNLEAARSLLSLGANPNHCKSQAVPLIVAIKTEKLELVQTLLEHGASVSQCDTNGNSPLHAAVISENSRVVEILLKHSADVNATNEKNQTPLHLAIERTKKQTNRSFRVERSLLNNGADLNALDFFKRTPLHYVFIDSNIVPITKETIGIKKKVDVLAQKIADEASKESQLASYSETYSLNDPPQYGNDKVNAWLKDIKKQQIEKEAAEKEAEKEKNMKEEDRIIIYDDEKEKLLGFNMFNWESKSSIPERFDPIDIAKYLLHFKGVTLDAVDYFGRTALHYAARVGAFSCSNLLIEKGASLNIVDTDQNGALQLALRGNYVDYSLMLFNNGAKITKNIVLQDGEETSTFGFSLSKSLINIAYLIMDSDLSLVELIGDALTHGKFHMVEILLQTSEEKALCETVPETGKNLWHALADFTPFSSKIWDDYLDEFVAKLSSLNIAITKDKYGNTPLHYAAMHGQTGLLKHLISINGSSINDFNKAFVSVLEFAVESRNIDCVKLLLGAGASISKHKKSKQESALLIAVKNFNIEMTKLLLENGSSTDDNDTVNRFSNSVMMSCLYKKLEILKLLIEYKADLNKPSYVTLTDKNNKKYGVALHPIFIASNAGEEYLKLFLEAGANPNVYGPKDEEKYGKSCFMYNTHLNNAKNMELILDYKIDVNCINHKNTRSIFYELFFSKMLGNKDSHELSSKISVPERIFEKMMRLCTPEVNQVDTLTKMTPLELAISKQDITMIESLLDLGANVNTESCGDYEHSSIGYLMNIAKTPIPAILHALLQNNADILKLIYKKTHSVIDWSWEDSDGNNMVAYITGVLTGFSHTGIEKLLTSVESQAGVVTFKNMIRQKNTSGQSPALYAYHRKNKSLYNILLNMDSTLQEFIEEHYDIDLFGSSEETAPMDLDGITMQEVEEFAQIERENLRREKELEDIKNGKKVDPKEDESLKIDKYSKLADVATVEIDQDISTPYNIKLMKVELQSWGDFTDTSIYKLAIYYNKLVNVYVLWTRWGPFGKEGQHQKTPYLSKEEAVAEFKSIFKSKTGNPWETHKESFQAKPGRYEIFEKAKHPRDTIIKNFDFLRSNVESQLSSEVLDVLKLVCNFNYLSKVYKDAKVDMPMGQIPQSRIQEAKDILNETSKLIDTYQELRICFTDRAKITESHLYAYKIAQKCVAYSRLLPRYGEANQPIRSLYHHNKSMLEKEISKVDDLSYVGFAADVILAAKHHVNKINPLDYAFRTLDCSLKNIPTSTDYPEYALIKKYMDSSSPYQSQDIIRLFSVSRAEEAARYRPHENDPNRKLLWHGSRIGNFMGILKQGLRIAPGTTDQNGALLGPGVYFADTFVKSLGYSQDYYGSGKSAYKIMLLCEVALGSKQGHYIDEYIEDYEKYDSIHGQGLHVPDPNNAIYDSNNVCIPIGPCIPYKSKKAVSPHLNYNEFTVRDISRVKIRYLMVLRESNTCYLCSTRGSLDALSEQDVSGFGFQEFNSYEREIVKAYLVHQKKNVQDIFNQELDHVLQSKSYKKTWDTPLDMQKEDLVCKTCCLKMVSSMLEQYILKNEDSYDILDVIHQRPRCRYGKECRTQEKISHAKHYSHWFFEKVPEENASEKANEETNSEGQDEDTTEAEDSDEDMDDEDDEGTASEMDEDD